MSYLRVGSSLVHIHDPQPSMHGIRVLHCPTCERRRRMWRTYTDWYGSNLTCLTCGEEWQDGVRCQRPFQRGWRQENVAAARAQMKRMQKS